MLELDAWLSRFRFRQVLPIKVGRACVHFRQHLEAIRAISTTGYRIFRHSAVHKKEVDLVTV